MQGEQRIGDFLVIDDWTGFREWRSECVKTWDGFLVHRRHIGQEQQRHPQDLIKPVMEDVHVPDARPEGEDVFLTPGQVTAADL